MISGGKWDCMENLIQQFGACKCASNIVQQRVHNVLQCRCSLRSPILGISAFANPRMLSPTPLRPPTYQSVIPLQPEPDDFSAAYDLFKFPFRTC